MTFAGARDFDLLETTGAVTPPRTRRRSVAHLRFAGVLLLYAAGLCGFALLIVTIGLAVQP